MNHLHGNRIADKETHQVHSLFNAIDNSLQNFMPNLMFQTNLGTYSDTFLDIEDFFCLLPGLYVNNFVMTSY